MGKASVLSLPGPKLNRRTPTVPFRGSPLSLVVNLKSAMPDRTSTRQSEKQEI